MTEPSATDCLADLAERYWRFQCHEGPTFAILAGEDVDDPVLFREAPADFDRRDAVAAGMLAELDGIDGSDLDAQNQATHRLLSHELGAIRALYAVGAHHRPTLFPTGPAMSATYFANTTTISDRAEADRYVERLASVPAYLGDVRANLEAGRALGIRYPRVVIETAASNFRATVAGEAGLSTFLGPFERSTVSSSNGLDSCAVRCRELVEREIVPAFERLADYLEGTLGAEARDTVACSDSPGGGDYYRALVRDFTTLDIGPDEVHELGLAEVDRLERAMEDVAADAGYTGDLGGFREHLGSPGFFTPTAEALRERLEILCKRIDGLIPSYFGHLPRITYGVRSIPEAMAERVPAAYAQPNPADRSAPGVMWVTSLPDRCPTPMHVPLALHEAWPGHLMHIALMQEADHLPLFRRHGAIRYPVCIEGWAIYCEGLGVDMGLYETPHQHYGRLEMEIWRALRLVVDTGIHWLGWSREQAIDTMERHMAMPRATIAAEVDRYICWPGQALAYQIGNLEFRKIRKRCEARLGDRFSFRRFHDRIIAAGPATIPVLNDLVDDMIAETTGVPD